MHVRPCDPSGIAQATNVFHVGVPRPILHEHDLFAGRAEQIFKGDQMTIARLDVHEHGLRVGHIDLREQGRERLFRVEHGDRRCQAWMPFFQKRELAGRDVYSMQRHARRQHREVCKMITTAAAKLEDRLGPELQNGFVEQAMIWM
jgi:hypothetical protein